MQLAIVTLAAGLMTNAMVMVYSNLKGILSLLSPSLFSFFLFLYLHSLPLCFGADGLVFAGLDMKESGCKEERKERETCSSPQEMCM